ncbi:MAG: 30S ribosomal protein S7 [Methanocalculaceae archaeon]|jgi:small subunit ribosomal protein S7|nr:30S ribosomal protein S7 [Methanocalculaceae archaeon]
MAERQVATSRIPLFNKWDTSEIVVKDAGLIRYITVTSTEVPSSCGRLTQQQFTKSQMAIVERLINRLMQTETNTGKKQLCTRIVMDAFDEIHVKTKQNPLQILVDAVANAGPREETVRLKYGGINVPKSVDSAPTRRVNTALRYIAMATWKGSHKTKKPAHLVLANELIMASKGDAKCFSVGKKEEIERIAKSAR